ncbi:mechanosensitive ion channel family protein [soil metagenome]
MKRPNRTPRKALAVMAWTALLVLLAAPLSAAVGQALTGQARPATDSASRAAAAQATLDRLGAPVFLDRDTLFYITARLGPFGPVERAAAVRQRLLELARNPFVRIDSLLIVEDQGRSDIMLRDLVITSVSELDTIGTGLTREALARERAGAIAHALERSAVSTNLRTILMGLIYSMRATAALILLLRLLNQIFTRLHRLVRQTQATRIRSVTVQNLELLSADRIATMVTGLLRLMRLVLTLVLVYFYLLLVFSFFPWTRGVAALLVNYVTDPIARAFAGFLDYVPSLFSIIVIIALTYYFLKLIRMIFNGIGSGAITFSGFYQDWADPTYKIVRFMVIALSVILIWPHLPSSDSTAFKGVAAFLGLLLSFGSASAVANIIGGIVMVYMRPFQIGDRVKIADTVGDVVEKNLLVTRVRTTKNVDITVPNSMVLGSHIINYSSTARESALILHTTITIGYDVPWRLVHETMIAAARDCTNVLDEPAPFVLQTALNDYHVSYELNAYTDQPNRMARTYSELHQQLQDRFAAAGIEIMSPAYEAHRDGAATTIPSGATGQASADGNG